MKINRFRIQGIRSHRDSAVELSRINVFRGANAKGKTSIVQAAQIMLGGQCDVTDARGAGAAQLIRPGDDKAVVLADLQNGDQTPRTIRCSITERSGRDFKVKPAAQGEDVTEITKWFKNRTDLFSCLCNTNFFIELKPDQQKDLLAGIILPETYEWDGKILAAIEDLNLPKLPWQWTQRPFDVIEAAYTFFYKARTAINAEVKNFQFPEGDVTAAGPTEKAEMALRNLRNLKEEAIRKQAGLRNDLAHAQRQKEQIQQRIDEAENRMTLIRADITQAKSKIIAPKQMQKVRDRAGFQSRVAEIQREIVVLEAKFDVAAKAVKAALQLSKQGNCPTCSQKITEDVAEAILAPLVAEENTLGTQINDLRHELEQIGEVQTAVNALKEHEQATIDLERAEEREKEVQNIIAKLTQERDKPTEATEDPSLFDEKIADFERRISVGTEQLGKITAANVRKEAQATASKNHAALVKKQKNIEKLVEYFGPDGVKAALLQEHVGGFVERMNSVLQKWGYACSLSFEPYQFGVLTGSRKWPLQVMSKSERLRFGIAFQIALAITTGLNFVIIDEADMLDTQGRTGLLRAVISESALDQAIILITDEKEEVKAIPDTSWFMLSAERVDDITTTTIRQLMPAV